MFWYKSCIIFWFLVFPSTLHQNKYAHAEKVNKQFQSLWIHVCLGWLTVGYPLPSNMEKKEMMMNLMINGQSLLHLHFPETNGLCKCQKKIYQILNKFVIFCHLSCLDFCLSKQKLLNKIFYFVSSLVI